MAKKSENTGNKKDILFPAISLVLFLLLWELSVRVFGIRHWILPAPGAILKSFVEGIPLIAFHTGRTVFEAVAGLSAGTVMGVLVAFLISWSDSVKRIIYPYLLLTQSVPFIVIAPLLVVWFGYGIASKIILIALVCFFPVAINVELGLGKIPENYIRLGRSLGADKFKLYRFIKIPYSKPYFYTGLRIAASYSVLSAVISEWIGSDRGLGILLIRSAKSYQTDRVFAVVIVISALSLMAVKLVDLLKGKGKYYV